MLFNISLITALISVQILTVISYFSIIHSVIAIALQSTYKRHGQCVFSYVPHGKKLVVMSCKCFSIVFIKYDILVSSHGHSLFNKLLIYLMAYENISMYGFNTKIILSCKDENCKKGSSVISLKLCWNK